MEEYCIITQYKNYNLNLDDFQIFFKEDHFIFYAITTNKEIHDKILNYIKETIGLITSKSFLYIDDIDKKWIGFNKLFKSILILITQQKEISLQEFFYAVKESNYNYCCWGISPLPSWEEIIKDSKNQLKQGQK